MSVTPKLAGRVSLVLVGLLAAGGSIARATDAQFEAQLVWGTNSKTSPDPNHKPVDPEIREKLAKLHLKWENFFLVSKTNYSLAVGSTTNVVISPKCTLEHKLHDAGKVEVFLIGKDGERSCKQSQPLPKKEMMVFGGNAPNSTAWLVTLRRIE